MENPEPERRTLMLDIFGKVGLILSLSLSLYTHTYFVKAKWT
jgi:hypothetical protein